MEKVAIVILNWNGQKMLAQYLPSLLQFTPTDARIYVADNASTDTSVDFVKTTYPSVKIIQLEQNFGFAEGYNRALQQVDATYYVILNSDVLVTENWLNPLVDFMDQHPDCAACQPKLLSVADNSSFEYAGAAGGFIDALGYPFCRGRLFDTVEQDNHQYDAPCEIHWATGACMFVRRDSFWSASGFDARFFAHNEEIDLCWRMRMRGEKIYSVPACSVFHVGGGTLPKGNPKKTFLNFRNNLTMLYKNLPEHDLKRVMRWRWLLDYVAAYQTLLCNFNVKDFRAIYKARRAFKQWKHEFDVDRKKIQQQRVDNAQNDRKPYSILWQYYALRHKTFDKLPQ